MTNVVTARAALELAAHEAMCLEAYKDSVGVWTWSVGVTSKSGHAVERYKDNPQPLRRCLEVWLWVLQTYADDVNARFAGHPLTEAQFAAALSFHYNTGAIAAASTSWPRYFMAGEMAKAEASFKEWRNPPEVIARRAAEADLLFRGVWVGDDKVTVYDVSHRTYAPIWSSGRRVAIGDDVRAVLGEGAPKPGEMTIEERVALLEARVARLEG